MADEHARARGHASQDPSESPIDAGIRRSLQWQLDRRRFLALSSAALGTLMLGARTVHAQSPGSCGPGRHAQPGDLAELSQPGDPRRLHCRDRGPGQSDRLRFDGGDGGQDPGGQQRYRCGRAKPVRHRGMDGGWAPRTSRLRPAAGCGPVHVGPPVRGPGVRPGQRPYHPQELGDHGIRLLDGRREPRSGHVGRFLPDGRRGCLRPAVPDRGSPDLHPWVRLRWAWATPSTPSTRPS